MVFSGSLLPSWSGAWLSVLGAKCYGRSLRCVISYLYCRRYSIVSLCRSYGAALRWGFPLGIAWLTVCTLSLWLLLFHSQMGLSENRVYSQWNSHLIGIMISKTIGFRGTQHFQTHPNVIFTWPLVPCTLAPTTQGHGTAFDHALHPVVDPYEGMAINPLKENYMPIIRIPFLGWMTITHMLCFHPGPRWP